MEDILDLLSDLIDALTDSKRRWVRWLGIGCAVLLVGGFIAVIFGVIALVNGLPG